MLLLTIDTSTEFAGIGLFEDTRLLVEVNWHAGQNHTTRLLPHLENLLVQAGVKLEAIEGLVVATGPGSFNGLRVGLSSAKGLAFSLDIPVAGVGTLEAAAYQVAAAGLPVCAVANAGREELAVAMFQKNGDDWQRLAGEHITNLLQLCAGVREATVFTGEHVMQVKEKLRENLGSRAVFPPDAALFRRPGFAAELGWRRLRGGDSDNVTTLQPVYLRRPPITERKAR